MTSEPEPHAISQLYRELQPQLARILLSNLKAPEWVVEDACQIAWEALIAHRAVVARGGELGWLSTTATRQALRLMRRERMAESYDKLPGNVVELAPFRAPQPEQQLELCERLAEIRALPERQRLVVMLQGFGYDYEEIAAATGETRRTVARQLTRARRRLLHLAGDG